MVKKFFKKIWIFLILVGVIFIVNCSALKKIIKPRLPVPHKVNGKILFQYYAPNARIVTLAGSFNSWGGTASLGYYDPKIDPMNDDGKNGDKVAGDGIWSILKELPPGLHQYKFVVDYNIWVKDPSNPFTAIEGGIENSAIWVK